MRTSVQVQIEEAFAAQVSPDGLISAARATLEAEGFGTGGVTLVVTDSETLRELNQTYLGIDAPTDVLSFGGESPDFANPPNNEAYLGDVVIAYPQAELQATATNHPIHAELALLVVHGVLHLLGYDHVTPEDRAAMWKRQAEVLSQLGLAYIQPD